MRSRQTFQLYDEQIPYKTATMLVETPTPTHIHIHTHTHKLDKRVVAESQKTMYERNDIYSTEKESISRHKTGTSMSKQNTT